MAAYAAARLASIEPSASAGISQQAKRLRADGINVIDLGLGEPDFDTPQHVIEAAYQAARNGQTRYPPTAGTAELKTAIGDKLRRDNQLDFTSDELVVCNGAKQVIFNALMATVEAGDEVILVAPYFDSYRNIIDLLGARRQVVQTSAAQHFQLQPTALRAALNPKTRWLLLNAPSNPAGATYSRADLAALGDVLTEFPDVLVLSDEIYEHITFDGVAHTSFLAACPQLAGRVLTVNGVSKAYAMTGWRIGYGAGPRALIDAMATVQSLISSGACSIAQAAAAAALNGPQQGVEQFRSAFERRRNLVVDAVKAMPGIRLHAPGGAFYALMDCTGLLSPYTELADDNALAAYLLEHAKVAAVPGSVYEAPGFIRISTACEDAELKSALDRIAATAVKLLS